MGQDILKEIERLLNQSEVMKGDLKKLAKSIKVNHQLALDLWSKKEFNYRLLSVLIMDKKALSEDVVRQLIIDLDTNAYDDSLRISEWFMANQLMKYKPTMAMMLTWKDDEVTLMRRLFWYYQARLRWTGKIPIDNADELLGYIEEGILDEEEAVRWTMNFCAAQIGIFEDQYRSRCIALGETYGLYKDEVGPKGCVPNYLPEFIRIQVDKMK